MGIYFFCNFINNKLLTTDDLKKNIKKSNTNFRLVRFRFSVYVSNTKLSVVRLIVRFLASKKFNLKKKVQNFFIYFFNSFCAIIKFKKNTKCIATPKTKN